MPDENLWSATPQAAGAPGDSRKLALPVKCVIRCLANPDSGFCGSPRELRGGGPPRAPTEMTREMSACPGPRTILETNTEGGISMKCACNF